MKKIRKLNPGERPTASEWNSLVDAVAALCSMRGSAPINVSQIGGVPVVSIGAFPESDQVKLIKITDVHTAIGKYKCQVWQAVGTALDADSDLVEDDICITPIDQDCWAWNFEEVGSAGSPDHILTPADAPHWFLAWPLGLTDEDTPKQVYGFWGSQAVDCAADEA